MAQIWTTLWATLCQMGQPGKGLHHRRDSQVLMKKATVLVAEENALELQIRVRMVDTTMTLPGKIEGTLAPAPVAYHPVPVVGRRVMRVQPLAVMAMVRKTFTTSRLHLPGAVAGRPMRHLEHRPEKALWLHQSVLEVIQPLTMCQPKAPDTEELVFRNQPLEWRILLSTLVPLPLPLPLRESSSMAIVEADGDCPSDHQCLPMTIRWLTF